MQGATITGYTLYRLVTVRQPGLSAGISSKQLMSKPMCSARFSRRLLFVGQREFGGCCRSIRRPKSIAKLGHDRVTLGD
jgi:hypothetical protein